MRVRILPEARRTLQPLTFAARPLQCLRAKALLPLLPTAEAFSPHIYWVAHHFIGASFFSGSQLFEKEFYGASGIFGLFSRCPFCALSPTLFPINDHESGRPSCFRPSLLTVSFLPVLEPAGLRINCVSHNAPLFWFQAQDWMSLSAPTTNFWSTRVVLVIKRGQVLRKL